MSEITPWGGINLKKNVVANDDRYHAGGNYHTKGILLRKMHFFYFMLKRTEKSCMVVNYRKPSLKKQYHNGLDR